MARDSDLPIYNPVSDGKKAGAWRLRPVDRRIHFIPLIVVICFIILWIFGSKPPHQGSISIEDEEDKDYNVEPNEISESEDMKKANVLVDLAMLGLATTTINVSDPERRFRARPGIEPSSVPVTGVTKITQSLVPVTGLTDLNPGSSASQSFGSQRLLIQEGNIENENFSDMVEIKKPVRMKETQIRVEPPFQASPEIEPLTSRVNSATDLIQEGNVTYATGNVTIKDEKVNELN